MLIAIDNGYWDTKVFDGQNKFKFRSKVEKGNSIFKANNTHIVYYKEVEYLVGEGATTKELIKDKTSNEFYKICTYTGLGLLSSFEPKEFSLVVGYPLSLYASNRELFADYLLEDSKDSIVEIEVDGELKRFKINDCLVLPQGVGALYNHSNEFENTISGIIDIGGLTVNGVMFDKLNVIKDSIFTIDKGMYNLYTNIKKGLETKMGLYIHDYEIPYIISKGYRDEYDEPMPEVDNLIQNIINTQVQEIITTMLQNNWSLRTNILLIGGGAILLYNFFKQHIPKTMLSDNPVWENVLGFYGMGGEYYGY